MCGFPREADLRAGSGGEHAPWNTNASLWWRCRRWTVALRGRTHLRRVITGPTCSVSPAKGVVWSWGDENRLHLNSNRPHCAHNMTLHYYCYCCYFPYLCVLTRIILLEMSNWVQIDTLKHFFSGGADFFPPLLIEKCRPLVDTRPRYTHGSEKP